MGLWVSLTLLAAVLPAGLSLALTTAPAPAPRDPATIRASYRRPDVIPFPSSNPYSEAKSALGQMLFFDPLLSRSKTRSCATCHNPTLSWGDGLPRAIGEDPKGMPIRSPTLIDVAFFEPLGWDGKFRDLESVAFGPLLSPMNLNMTEAELIARLSAISGYADAFTHAFGDAAITRPRIEQSLATFERSIVAGEAPFDRWIKGDDSAISASARHGFELFNGKARCSSCHSGPSFSDGSFQDIGTAKGNDIGRGRFFPTSAKLKYAFKTPTLRDVARRAPYMHDGSVPTLEDVIDLYNRGGIERPSRSPDIRPLSLTASEKKDLVAFLESLTATNPPLPGVPKLPR